MSLEKEKEILVIHLFLTLDNNTAPAISKQMQIAEKIEITAARVDRILTKYLKSKTIHES